jgi:polyamine oxidase
LATDSYDDGRAEVPGGVTRPVERVIVVGAGISGLTVANALRHGGIECVVIEARDRLGGRLHTVDLAGSPVDMGGSWIHHPVGNPMRAFADQIGVACRPANPLAEMAGFDFGVGKRLSSADVQASLRMQFEEFPEAIEGLRVELGPHASAADAIDAFVARLDVAPVVARQAFQALRAVIEGEVATTAEQQSLQWMWNEMEYGGDFFGDVPAGGYRSLVTAMAAGVDVRLGTEVAEIVVSPDQVALRSRRGVEIGSHVVVTVPLGVLKRGAPRFSPPLPAERLAAIERLGFGRFEKVALRFSEPFWRAAGFPHLMLFPADPDAAARWMLGEDGFGGDPTLVALFFHSAAGQMLEGTHEEAVDRVLELVAEAIGAPCPAPIASAVSSWGTDPYSGGAYTHIPVGADPADLDLLGEPIGGRLLFAGEHTQSARVTYADGAMTSGIREAKRLLNTHSVRLGR